MNHEHTRPYYGGVLSSNELIHAVKDRPVFYVVNTDTSDGPGKHWVLLYLHNPYGFMEWFDPLGKPPEYYSNHFVNFLSDGGKKQYFINENPVQNIESDKCGYFCVFMADKRSMGVKYDDVYASFSTSNTLKNDSMVVGYVKGHM